MSAAIKDIAGMKFGRLAVAWPAGRHPHNGTAWLCFCDCGAFRTAFGSELRRGKSVGCSGCHWKAFRTHGHTVNRKVSGEYRSWYAMIQRCTNPKRPDFPYYGGRGITVNPLWRHSFEAFIADMGEKPTKAHTIERIDNEGNYEKENCTWATRKQQANNRR